MRASYFVSPVISFLAFALLGGCAQRIDDLDEKIADLQQRASALEVKTGSPVGTDRDLLEGQKLADVRSQLSTIRNELMVMAGKVEAVEYETKRLNSRVETVAQELEKKLRELSRGKAAVEAPASASQAESAGETGPEAEYNKGLKAHQEGDFAAAEKLFSDFAKKNPRHPLADNALFWVGDGYMSQKAYKNAIAKFQDMIEHYPKSDKKCEAMAKQVAALKELGLQKESQQFSKARDAECK